MSKIHVPAICLFLALAAPVHAQTYKVLHNFGSSPGDPSCPKFAGTIAQSPPGSIDSSANDCLKTDGGSVYKISVNGTVTVIHRFTSKERSSSSRGRPGFRERTSSFMEQPSLAAA